MLNILLTHVLASLNLELNRFEGSLPTIIYSLTNLVHLHLSHNEFAGSLHDSFQMLPNLEELRLNSNYLTGTFPASLHSLKRLSESTLLLCCLPETELAMLTFPNNIPFLL